MPWMTVADFKSQTGITLDDSLVQEALNAGAAIMKRWILIPNVYKTRAINAQQILTYSYGSDPIRIYIGDFNEDSTIDLGDLNIYEIDSNYVEYPLVPTSVNFKYGVLNFATPVPTSSDRIFVCEWYEAISDLDKILPMMVELNQIEAVTYLFTKVPFEKLQSGISSWNLNGVSVAFDLDAVQAVIAGNQARAKYLYNLLIPLYTRKTPLQAPSRVPLSNYLTTLSRR